MERIGQPVEMTFRDEISLRRIMESGQCFRWVKEGDGYFIPHRGEGLLVWQLDAHTLSMRCGEAENEAVWRAYFDGDTDYAGINGRISGDTDAFLHRAMLAQRGVRILRQDAWEMLITSIITQNRNIPAIRKSVELLSEMAGDRCEGPDGRQFFAFPSPEQLASLPDEKLAACRLGYRQGYVKAAAQAVASGALDIAALQAMPDADCLASLLSLRGVGEKVAACVMLFGLHRLDAFPVDVWMKRILANEYPAGYPMAEYSPYNGIYQQYMFAYYREKHA